MTSETALQRTSAVDPELAKAMQISDRLTPLKNALGIQDFTEQEVQLFAMVAQRSGLDPFAKQIYAIKRGGKVTYQTGIDGYRSTAAKTREYAGSDEATYEDCPCGQAPQPHPSVARVVVKRIHSSGRLLEQVGIARYHEVKPSPDPMGLWTKMPYNQTAKCAEANGLRKLFPTVLADLYITDEMEQAGPAENAALVQAATAPKPADRLAARRAVIQGTVIEQQAPAAAARSDEPDLFEGSDAAPTSDTQDEAVPSEGPAAATAVSAAASSASTGYQAFRTRFLASDPHPTEADVRKAAKKHEKDIPDLAMKQVKDWPLTDASWKALADSLNLPAV